MSPCKVETICHMYQTLIAEAMSQGILKAPPPLLTRVYQELGNGVIKFQEAHKFNLAPYPFPYVAVADMLMLVHWLFTPFMIGLWTKGALSSFCFTFIQTFALWSLKSIAGQLDNPYGTDITDLDAQGMSENFNRMIRTLVHDQSFSISTDGLVSREPSVDANDVFLNPTSSLTIAEIMQTHCEAPIFVLKQSKQHLSDNHLGRKWLGQKKNARGKSRVLKDIREANIPKSSSAEGSLEQATEHSSHKPCDPHIAESSATMSREQQAEANCMGGSQERLEPGTVRFLDSSSTSQQEAIQPPCSKPTTFGQAVAFAFSLQEVHKPL